MNQLLILSKHILCHFELQTVHLNYMGTYWKHFIVIYFGSLFTMLYKHMYADFHINGQMCYKGLVLITYGLQNILSENFEAACLLSLQLFSV